MDTEVVLGILAIHFIGDFLCQSDWMACGKSHDWYALFAHVGAYTLTLFVGCTLLLTFYGGVPIPIGMIVAYVALNGVLHLWTDAVTSRVSAKLYTRSRHWFFCTIGFDQLIHQVTLLYTLDRIAQQYNSLQ